MQRDVGISAPMTPPRTAAAAAAAATTRSRGAWTEPRPPASVRLAQIAREWGGGLASPPGSRPSHVALAGDRTEHLRRMESAGAPACAATAARCCRTLLSGSRLRCSDRAGAARARAVTPQQATPELGCRLLRDSQNGLVGLACLYARPRCPPGAASWLEERLAAVQARERGCASLECSLRQRAAGQALPFTVLVQRQSLHFTGAGLNCCPNCCLLLSLPRHRLSPPFVALCSLRLTRPGPAELSLAEHALVSKDRAFLACFRCVRIEDMCLSSRPVCLYLSAPGRGRAGSRAEVTCRLCLVLPLSL